MNLKKTVKIIPMICWGLSLPIIYLAYFNPATSYEISLYSSTPNLIWYLVCINMILGIFLVSYEIFSENYKDRNLIYIGIGILALNMILVRLMPVIRDYYIAASGDTISHVGHVKDILLTGHFAESNHYPLMHVLVAEISIISDVVIRPLINWITSLFLLIYILFIYNLSSQIFEKKGRIISILLVSIAFIGSRRYAPMGYSLLFIPFFYFLFFKYLDNINDKRLLFLLLLILVVYPLFHLATLLMLIISLLIITLLIYFKNKENFLGTSKLYKNYLTPLNLTIIGAVLFIIWSLRFRIFHTNLRSFINQIILGRPSGAYVEQVEEGIAKMNLSTGEFARLVVLEEGISIIMIALAFISFFLLYKKLDKKRNFKVFMLLIVAFFMGFIYSGEVFGFLPGVPAVAGIRFFRFFMHLSPVIVLPALYLVTDKKNKIKVLFVCLLIIISILGVFTAHTSPIVHRPTEHTTEMDIRSGEWYIQNKNLSLDEAVILTNIRRLGDLTWGRSRTRETISKGSLQAPDHFNYTQHERLSESFEEDKLYLYIDQRDKIIYDTVYEEVGRFDEADFEKLEEDPSVSKIYDNGGNDVWIIQE